MENKLQKNMLYILQFAESPRFMASLVLNIVNNLYAGIQKTKCK